MDKYTNSLSEEIKEIFEAQEKHWVAKWDDKMYYTHRNGLKLCFEEIQKRAEELEERCNNQWLKIQGDAEHISDLEAKLAEKETEIKKLNCQIETRISNTKHLLDEVNELENEIIKKDNLIKEYSKTCVLGRFPLEHRAMQELEKTLAYINNKYYLPNSFEICCYVKSQIEELKKEMK